jgi:hypothetical protein
MLSRVQKTESESLMVNIDLLFLNFGMVNSTAYICSVGTFPLLCSISISIIPCHHGHRRAQELSWLFFLHNWLMMFEIQLRWLELRFQDPETNLENVNVNKTVYHNSNWFMTITCGCNVIAKNWARQITKANESTSPATSFLRPL